MACESVRPQPSIKTDQKKKKKKPSDNNSTATMKHDDDLDALFAELGIESNNNLNEGHGESKAARKRREKKEREAEADSTFQERTSVMAILKWQAVGTSSAQNLTAREACGKNSSRSLRQGSRGETSSLMLKRIS